MGLSFIALILAVAIIAIVIRSKNDLSTLINVIDTLSEEMRAMRREITAMKEELNKLSWRPKENADYNEYRPKQDNEIKHKPLEDTPADPIVYSTPSPEEQVPPTGIPDPGKLIHDQEVFSLHDLIPDSEPVTAFTEPEQRKSIAPVYVPEESWWDAWLSRNPDLEKFIGENLINKVGIAVLVLGIAFFVKYAIDKDWINETGRVCIGIGCGAILSGLAHYLRNSYRSFSSVLAGGGIAVFYFTIAFAFHQYGLMSQTAAFVIMVIITAFAVALSVLYDKLELAIIASIGGFITPFLVSTGDGNYIVLFTYLIILNIGLLSLAWFKRWPVLNIISLFFTEVIYGSWLGLAIADNKPISYPVALMFATTFYLIFLGMNMVYQVKNRQSFKALDFIILLFISVTYYAAGMTLLHHWNDGAYQGLFTLGIGIINLLLAYYVYKNGKADRNLLFLLIGLTFSFITLTIPIQLHGHAITMFWSAEFVLLYWLSTHSGIRLFRYSSALLCVLTLFSLLMDWSKETEGVSQGLLLIFSNTQGIITNVIAIAAFAAYYSLLKKDCDTEFISGLTAGQVSKIMLGISFILLYVTSVFCVNLCFRHLSVYDIPNVYHLMITELYAIAILLLMQKGILKTTPSLQLPLVIVCFLYYIVSSEFAANLRNNVLSGHYAWPHMFAHWADSVLLGFLFYRSISGIRKHPDVFTSMQKPLNILFSILIVVFLSIELLHLYIIIGYRNGNIYSLIHQYSKAGLTAVWGICSFAMMWLGMKHKQKTIRIISLTLFSIVLLKLFIFDISGISEGGKIFAFILLGVLLLTVSFMYQKLKKIIIDDRKE